MKKENKKACHNIGKDDANRPGICKAEVSHQPEDDGMEFLLLGDGEEEHDDGRKKGPGVDPGKKQDIGMNLALLFSEIKDQGNGHERTCKRGKREAEGERAQPQKNRND